MKVRTRREKALEKRVDKEPVSERNSKLISKKRRASVSISPQMTRMYSAFERDRLKEYERQLVESLQETKE